MMGDSMEKETNKKTTSAKKKNTSSKSNSTKKNNTQNSKKNIKGNNNTSKGKVENSERKVAEKTAKKEVVIEEEKVVKEKEKFVIENNEFIKLLKLILIVTGIFLAFYLVTYLFTDNTKVEDDEEKAEVSIQYDEILLSNLLTQKDKEYYVLAYDAEDKYYDSYNMYIYTYSAKEDAKRIYTSVLSNGFNKKYYDKTLNESVTDIENISDLKLKDTTLIRIKKGKIRNVYEGHEEIINFLSTLGK